jgi:ATP-binding cassette subfamily B protein
LKALKELNRYLRKYKLPIALGTLFLTTANFFLVWIPVLIRQTMDEVEGIVDERTEVSSNLLVLLFNSEEGWVLAQNSLILIGAVMMYGLFLFATRQTIIVTSRKVEFDIRNDIVEKLMRLPQRFYKTFSSGEVYVRASEDVNKVREYYGPVIMYSINTITRAAFVLTMMYLVNKELMLWALIPLPLLSVFAYWFTGYIHKHSIIIQEQYSVLAGKAQETFNSIRLIKAFNREDYEQKRFEEESESYRKKKLRLDLIESLFHPTLNFLIGISLIIVIWKGGMMVIEGSLTVGNIAEFLIYVAYLIWPVAALGYTMNRFQKSLASWNRIKEILDYEVHIDPSKPALSEVNEIQGDIEFRNVSFHYPDSDVNVLEDVNLKIKAGTTIAIAGRTGSGKTTLVQLLPRLFDPTRGEVLIDGKNLKDLPVDLLRKHMGVVTQDTFLFSDTIGENIAFGVEEATQEQIEDAAEQAQVRDNILDFEKNFKTILGERGITLSGGQKQRTAIARALIKNPKILILDDSLSAVDAKTEDAILSHLNKGNNDRTTIMISHRISTIKNADYIYYLEDGRIREQGTHEELIAQNGHYSAMYNKQLLEQQLAEI